MDSYLGECDNAMLGRTALLAVVPAARADRVAERALRCCSVVLERSAGGTRVDALELLQRLSTAAALPRAVLSEEVSHLGLRFCGCMQAFIGYQDELPEATKLHP